MKTDVNGCSTCKPGQEQWEEFINPVSRKVQVQYDYRSLTGRLFSCIEDTLQECRKKRNQWMEKRGIIA